MARNIRPRARPIHAPTMSPAARVTSAAAKYADMDTLTPATSIRARMPSTNNIVKNVIRPSMERSRGGFGGLGGLGCGGAAAYGDWPASAHGPCGANGGRYPPGGGAYPGGTGGSGSVGGSPAGAVATVPVHGASSGVSGNTAVGSSGTGAVLVSPVP